MKDRMWCMLLHLGGNMWNEEGNTRGRENSPDAVASPKLRFSKSLWDRYLPRMKEAGVNTILLDLGEGLRYESHPELAVEGSWTGEEMAGELEKLRAMGFEVVPKLNFSACHDVWLGEYGRMLSTSVYYQVCADLIREVCQIFRPKYFHLGMDEETAGHQANYDYCVIRQHDQWWHDFYFLADAVERGNARPWIWSDYMWNHRETFLKKMPKSVVQSNWYYSPDFENVSDGAKNMLECFEVMDRYGYDQVPAGSTWSDPVNLERLAAYCLPRIAPDRLLGFMQTPWFLTLDENEPILNEAAKRLGDAKHRVEG